MSQNKEKLKSANIKANVTRTQVQEAIAFAKTEVKKNTSTPKKQVIISPNKAA